MLEFNVITFPILYKKIKPGHEKPAPIQKNGFSTKVHDRLSEDGDGSDLIYYGYRHYSPKLGRFISRDPIEEAGGINLYAMAGNDTVNDIDQVGLAPALSTPFDPYEIIGIMKAQPGGWCVACTLMEQWIDGGLPEDIDKKTVTMEWLLGFERAKKRYDEIFSENQWQDEGKINSLAKKYGAWAKGGNFGTVTGDPVSLTKDYEYTYEENKDFVSKTDELSAALGRVTLRTLVEGRVCVKKSGDREVCVKKVGVYITDSYDFNGTWFNNQWLGFWNKNTNYVGVKPWKGSLVRNSSFRDYRKRTGKGTDYLIYSDIKVTKLDPPFCYEP